MPIGRRRDVLRQARRLVVAKADTVAATISNDFGGRSWHETMISEIAMVLAAIDHALPRLARWSRPEQIAVG